MRLARRRCVLIDATDTHAVEECEWCQGNWGEHVGAVEERVESPDLEPSAHHLSNRKARFLSNKEQTLRELGISAATLLIP